MEEISYWNRFESSGKIEDYLEFSKIRAHKEGTVISQDAGFSMRNGDDNQNRTYRGVRQESSGFN